MRMKPDERICDTGEDGDAVSAVETASNALTALVRLVARQAADEVFTDAKETAASPASPPTKMESDDG